MKKRTIILVIAALLLYSAAWADSKPCKKCWTILKAKGIKTLKLKIMAKNNAVLVDMKGIKQALEKAGINEKVSVMLQVDKNNLGSLGSFAPKVKDDGEHGDSKVHFASMPAAAKLKVKQGTGMPVPCFEYRTGPPISATLSWQKPSQKGPPSL